eukprot:7378222-Prymnesium_polylepis.2
MQISMPTDLLATMSFCLVASAVAAASSPSASMYSSSFSVSDRHIAHRTSSASAAALMAWM